MIRKAIEEGKTQEAQNKLKEFFDLIENAKNELSIQTGELNRLLGNQIQGILPLDKKNIQENKITLATLLCCHKIEEKLTAYFPTLKFKVSTESLDDQVSLKLMNQYDQIKKIHEGASAIFFFGEKNYTNQKVIIRVIKDIDFNQKVSNQINDPRLKKALNIKHRNIIKVLGSDLKSYPRYLVLEYIDGISLDHLIGYIPFTFNRSLVVIRQLCEALYHLHVNGIIHQNIKPDKILIDNELKPVVSPFDIVSSKRGSSANSINIQQLMYAAPEFLKGKTGTPDYQWDQFSLGLVAYELITGFPLFGNELNDPKRVNIQEVFEKRRRFFKIKNYRKKMLSKLDVPKKMEAIIAKMLSEHPSDRYASMKEVVADLAKVKMSVDEDMEVAMASYERCCIVNPNFTQQFYQRLFEEAKHKEDIVKFFNKNETIKAKTRRERMLRVAIELLIQNREESLKLEKILGLKVHHNISFRLYESFINTIVETIAANDFLWKKYDKAQKENPIKKAWESVKETSFKAIRAALE